MKASSAASARFISICSGTDRYWFGWHMSQFPLPSLGTQNPESSADWVTPRHPSSLLGRRGAQGKSGEKPLERCWPGQQVRWGRRVCQRRPSPHIHEVTDPNAVKWNSPKAVCLGGRSCLCDPSCEVTHGYTTIKHGRNALNGQFQRQAPGTRGIELLPTGTTSNEALHDANTTFRQTRRLYQSTLHEATDIQIGKLLRHSSALHRPTTKQITKGSAWHAFLRTTASRPSSGFVCPRK